MCTSKEISREKKYNNCGIPEPPNLLYLCELILQTPLSPFKWDLLARSYYSVSSWTPDIQNIYKYTQKKAKYKETTIALQGYPTYFAFLILFLLIVHIHLTLKCTLIPRSFVGSTSSPH